MQVHDKKTNNQRSQSAQLASTSRLFSSSETENSPKELGAMSDNSEDDDDGSFSGGTSSKRQRNSPIVSDSAYGMSPPNCYADSDYFRLFNARNAKIIGFLAFIVVVVYHSALHLMSIRW